jgi:hypothetical protein
MAIEFQTEQKPINTSGVFSFSGPVRSYVIGISYWEFSFADGGDHQVLQLAAHVTSSKSGPDVAYHLPTTLSDSSGNSIAASSIIQVSCIADVGQGDQDNCVSLQNSANPLGNGSTVSPAIGTSIKFVETFLSGFEFSNSSVVDVWSVDTAASYSAAQLSAKALLDSAKTGGTTLAGTIDWGLLAAYEGEGRLASKAVSGTNGQSHVLQFADVIGADTGILRAVVFLQSFAVTYTLPNGTTGHWVNTIGGGVPTKNITVGSNPPVVQITPQVFIRDSSNNEQSTDSSVTMAVVVYANKVVLNDGRETMELRVTSENSAPDASNSRWEYRTNSEWHAMPTISRDGTDEVVLVPASSQSSVILKVHNNTARAITLQVTGNTDTTIAATSSAAYTCAVPQIAANWQIGGAFVGAGPLPDPSFKITKRGS